MFPKIIKNEMKLDYPQDHNTACIIIFLYVFGSIMHQWHDIRVMGKIQK